MCQKRGVREGGSGRGFLGVPGGLGGYPQNAQNGGGVREGVGGYPEVPHWGFQNVLAIHMYFWVGYVWGRTTREWIESVVLCSVHLSSD
jgi:hypothetical protein